MNPFARSTFPITLRDLLVVIAIISSGLAIAAHFLFAPVKYADIPHPVPIGYEEGLLTSISLMCLFLAVRIRPLRSRRFIQAALTLGAALLLWFAAVDSTVTVDWCPQCGRHFWTKSFRVYRVPVWVKSFPDHERLVGDIAVDLGVPCSHPYKQQQWVRNWGLLYACPSMAGTCCLGDSIQYNDIQPIVREMLAEHPDLPDEFHRKVLVEGDSAYLQSCLQEIQTRRQAARQLPGI